MRRIKSENTKPELLVRKLVHAQGYRYRLHRRDLPGKPDLTFASRRKVIFVHSCFWHGHEAEDCPDRRRPKSNLTYWGPKLARNRERDGQARAALEQAGWHVLVVWDCETRARDALAAKLTDFLSPAPRGEGR
jgi:DNA mismatch endonuclease (patch repair protein)